MQDMEPRPDKNMRKYLLASICLHRRYPTLKITGIANFGKARSRAGAIQFRDRKATGQGARQPLS